MKITVSKSKVFSSDISGFAAIGLVIKSLYLITFIAIENSIARY